MDKSDRVPTASITIVEGVLFLYYYFFETRKLFKILFIYLFIFGFTGSLLLCKSFSLAGAAPCLHYTGFSLLWLFLWNMSSRTRGLNSHGAWAQLLCDMWDLLETEIQPTSPALAGRCITTGLPGKSKEALYFKNFMKLTTGLLKIIEV